MANVKNWLTIAEAVLALLLMAGVLIQTPKASGLGGTIGGGGDGGPRGLPAGGAPAASHRPGAGAASGIGARRTREPRALSVDDLREVGDETQWT